MGITRDYLTSTVSDTLLPIVRRLVEDVVYEVLDHRRVPHRTEFKELTDELAAARAEITSLRAELSAIKDSVAAQEARSATALEELREAMKSVAQATVEASLVAVGRAEAPAKPKKPKAAKP